MTADDPMDDLSRCKTHPDAPHGFVRNASHNEDRYVCECEFWEHPMDDLMQEPVAWMSPGKERLEFSGKGTVYGSHTIPLFTSPPQRQPLTDEEIKEIFLRELGDLAVRIPPGWRKVVNAIEAAHGITPLD